LHSGNKENKKKSQNLLCILENKEKKDNFRICFAFWKIKKKQKTISEFALHF